MRYPCAKCARFIRSVSSPELYLLRQTSSSSEIICLLCTHFLGRIYGKSHVIYSDPPFATGKGFSRRIDQAEDFRKPVMWNMLKLGVGYSDTLESLDLYLSMLYLRPIRMRELLSTDWTLYLHLDWRAVHHARLLLKEIFGPANSQCNNPGPSLAISRLDAIFFHNPFRFASGGLSFPGRSYILSKWGMHHPSRWRQQRKSRPGCIIVIVKSRSACAQWIPSSRMVFRHPSIIGKWISIFRIPFFIVWRNPPDHGAKAPRP